MPSPVRHSISLQSKQSSSIYNEIIQHNEFVRIPCFILFWTSQILVLRRMTFIILETGFRTPNYHQHQTTNQTLNLECNPDISLLNSVQTDRRASRNKHTSNLPKYVGPFSAHPEPRSAVSPWTTLYSVEWRQQHIILSHYLMFWLLNSVELSSLV